jgi:hypothetical protein
MRALLIVSFCCWAFTSSAQVGKQDKTQHTDTLEVSCGKCRFGLKGKSCDLAIRVNGKSYYADGANIDEFGDAHDKEGFCNAIRKAEVQGKVVNDRFKISYIKLLAAEK